MKKPHICLHTGGTVYALDISEYERIIKWWTLSSDAFITDVRGWRGEILAFKRGAVECIAVVTQEAIDNEHAEEYEDRILDT